MELWRKNLYYLVAVQVLAGTSIIGLISFVPLFVHELGVTDSGAAGMWFDYGCDEFYGGAG